MPAPQAKALQVSSLQQELLQQMTRRTTSVQRVVKRAHIILEASEGEPATPKLPSTSRSILKQCDVGVIAGTRRSRGCK